MKKSAKLLAILVSLMILVTACGSSSETKKAKVEANKAVAAAEGYIKGSKSQSETRNEIDKVIENLKDIETELKNKESSNKNAWRDTHKVTMTLVAVQLLEQSVRNPRQDKSAMEKNIEELKKAIKEL